MLPGSSVLLFPCPQKMFDEADLVPLPTTTPSDGHDTSRPRDLHVDAEGVAVSSTSGVETSRHGLLSGRAAAADHTNNSMSDATYVCHVVEACAMGNEDVALAMSDGRLCHAKLSRPIELIPLEQRRWPQWTSWASRHGSVRQLTFSPAHDALLTLEHAKTAAGDQVFLGGYHQQRVAGADRRDHATSGGLSWVGYSIPLATSRACMAVCPCRGWAAVCTGSVVNLWAMSRPEMEPPSERPRAPRPRQARPGFEHALTVDLAELVGAGNEVAGVGREGGAKHIALFGNMLSVATDHAVFLVSLTFDVKGELPSRRRNTPASASKSPLTPTSGSDAQPSATSGRPNPSRSTPRDKVKPGSSRGPSSTAKSQAKDLQTKLTSRGGSSKEKDLVATGDDKPGSRGGGGVSTGLRYSGGKGETDRKSSGRDGVVEGAVLEAEDIVVCVLHPGGEDGSRAADGPAEPPPLLRAFEDDWEAFRAAGESHTEPWELETAPVGTDSSPVSLPVTGNPAVVDVVGQCDVVLARRVGSGEVVRELHLLPVSQRRGILPAASDSSSHTGGNTWRQGAPATPPCRLVLLTSKGATVCLVSPSPSSTLPTSPARSRASSAGTSSVSSFPPSPTSVSSSGRGVGFVGGANTLTGGKKNYPTSRQGSDLEEDLGEGGATIGDISEDVQQVILLRRSCRFNSDLVRASITSSFLFALTVEGLEVWSFPSDELSFNEREREWLDEGRSGGGAVTLTPSPPPLPGPSPRPCLLHVQKIEIDGVIPRLPARCMVSVGGARQGVLLFPALPDDQGVSLAYLARQTRRCLRTPLATDESILEDTSALPKAPSPANPFASPPELDDDSNTLPEDSWQQKLTAWRNGFCGFGGQPSAVGDGEHSAASPLALLLRLRTPTEAFRLLAAAEARASHPLPVAISMTFVSAGEGLHGALVAEAAAAWRAAVWAARNESNAGLAAGEGNSFENESGMSPTKAVGLEGILPGLVKCWRLQRAAARCASLIGRLLLEEAAGAVSTAGQTSPAQGRAAGQAYSRACPWLLASAEPVVDCVKRLQEVAALVVKGQSSEEPVGGSDGEAVDQTTVASSVMSSLDEEMIEHLKSYEAASERPSLGSEASLSRAMYESYLLPALDVRGSPGTRERFIALAPSLSSGDRGSHSAHLDNILSGLVAYLHAQDMRRFAQPRGLRDFEDEVHGSTPLALAVVRAGRVPWTTCAAASSQALAALDDQEKALSEGVRSNRSNSNGSSISLFSSGLASPGGTRSSSPANTNPVDRPSTGTNSRRRREGSENAAGAVTPTEEGDPAEDASARFPTQEWIAVARAVLVGYLEEVEDSATVISAGGRLTPSMGPSAPLANDRILQHACERHPRLVAPARGGAGALARALLMGGKARPLVSALVRLTSCGGSDGVAGTSGATLGPHRAQELLQLTGDCFSPTVDPLQALRVFGMPGRQIAARLDSLRRSSLDSPGDGCSPANICPGLFQPSDSDARLQSLSGMRRSADNRPGRNETKTLMAAARDFLSRRYEASLAQADRGAREEKLAQASGAPPAWQAALARNHALDRAILRYLIGAHLDDLRALENTNSGKTKAARSTPSTSTRAKRTRKTASSARARDRRDREGGSWADAVLHLLTGQVPRGQGGPADAHLDAITALVREVTWQGNGGDGLQGRSGCGMSPAEAAEVVTEAKRRLPITAPATAFPGDLLDDDEDSMVNDAVPWGSGGSEAGTRRAPWPWGPKAVPPSAMGAIVALAAALPPAGKLLAGVEVMLQVSEEVIAAAKAEAAVAAGEAAAASGSVIRGNVRTGASSSVAAVGETHRSVEEASRAAEQALLLYISEYCGKDPHLWASVTEYVRHDGDRQEVDGSAFASEDSAGQKLVGALLRRCGDELGGKAFVKALPEELDLMQCLDEVERNLRG